ncbi:MAG: hypothetical protein Q7K26_03165 [bacterium]|nr:hypothetical protein [bacterium]
MSEEKKGLDNITITLMIIVALFYDALQILLAFIFLGWVVGIFAGLTFYVWFKRRGLSFMKPKRFLTFGITSVIEMVPSLLIPLSALPTWTAAITYLALDSKLKKVLPTSAQKATSTPGFKKAA